MSVSPPRALSLTARTLFAELRELALALGATENIGDTPGAVVAKTLRGKPYLYYQYRDLAGTTRQAYLGPDDKATRARLARLTENRDARAAEMAQLDALRAAFLAAGGTAMPHGPFRVLKAFADAGVLRPGVGAPVLVGTHAFMAIGNLLGVHWTSQMTTQDVDVAAGRDIDIAIGRPDVPAAEILEQLDMGFIPVPALDPRSPSTSFRVRGKDLRVDLLTPLIGRDTGKPVAVRALNSYAQALRFLDYVLEGAQPVPVLSATGTTLVNIPSPARFALHKLIVSESRTDFFSAKAEKDRRQAAQVLTVLIEEAPDSLRDAREDLLARGKGWTDKLGRALKKIANENTVSGKAYLELRP